MEIQFTTRNKDSHILYHTYITLDNKNKHNISADYVQMSEQVFKNSSWENEKIVKIVLNNVR